MRKFALYQIAPDSPPASFPPVKKALNQPDGLLCFGGDLSVKRLLEAYRRGIFPWYSDSQPILWWTPDPRCVLFPDELKITRSLKKSLRNQGFEMAVNTRFTHVIKACSKPRKGDTGTWITTEMIKAYINLHHAGYAHSVEIYQNNQLAGGLYGVAIGKVFFGESMFSRVSDASKVALACLVRFLQSFDFQMIDCQVPSPHLYRLGACDILRDEFCYLLNQHTNVPDPVTTSGQIWHHAHVPTREFYFKNE